MTIEKDKQSKNSSGDKYEFDPYEDYDPDEPNLY
jgi:hypothetical protein